MNIYIGYRNRIYMLLVAFYFLMACNVAGSGKKTVQKNNPGTNSKTGIESNKILILKFYQALNDTNWAIAKSLIDTNYKHYYIKDTGFASLSWNGFEKGFRTSHNAFPDWKLTPVTIVAEGDYVSVLLNGKGTHMGSFAGIAPTNVTAIAPIMLLHQIKDGKLVADWEIMNTGMFINQLQKR